MPAKITHRENKKEGKIFSWVFWEYVLDPNEYISDKSNSIKVMVRSTDTQGKT